VVSAARREVWWRCELLVCNLLRCWACYVGFSSLFNSYYPVPPFLFLFQIGTTLKLRADRRTPRLATCGIYYAFWIFILPHFGKYRIRQEVLLLSDETSKAHHLVKVPLSELEVWDREHDVLGQRVADVRGSGAHSEEEDGKETVEKKEV